MGLCLVYYVCFYPGAAHEDPPARQWRGGYRHLGRQRHRPRLAALLPLTISLRDFAKVERIGDLPRKLPTVGAPAGLEPVVGDIAYYAPLNHLVVFAGDNAYASGLVRMGRVDTGLAALQRPGPLQVRIERMPN